MQRQGGVVKKHWCSLEQSPGSTSRDTQNCILSPSTELKLPKMEDVNYLMRASLVAQMIMNLPLMQETRNLFLDWEYSWRRKWLTQSNSSAWRTWRTEDPGRLQSMELQGVKHNGATNTLLFHLMKHSSFQRSQSDNLENQRSLSGDHQRPD